MYFAATVLVFQLELNDFLFLVFLLVIMLQFVLNSFIKPLIYN
jgi:hypothetical protein